jgi:hypothetical protein
MRRSVLIRIALWSIVAGLLCLVMLRGVPIDVGFEPGTNPIVLWLAKIVIFIHFPALLIGFHIAWSRTALYGWWLLASLIGYVDIALVATLTYWVLMVGSRMRLGRREKGSV